MNPPLKIKVKATKGASTPSQGSLLESINAVTEGQLQITQIYGLRDGILLTLRTRADVYKLLSKEVQAELKKKNLQAVNPPWLHPSKSLVATKVADAITERKVVDIVKDIRESHPGIGLEDVIILPNRFQDSRRLKAMKFVFSSMEQAEAVLQSGLRIFRLNIPPEQLQKHRGTDTPKIMQCYQCFKFSHPSSACPENDIFCSICGTKGHHFTKCPSPTTPTCINCNQPHIAVSYECQIRLDLIESLKKRSAQSQPPIPPPQPVRKTPAPLSPITNPQDFPPLPSKTSDLVNATVHAKLINTMSEIELEFGIQKAIHFTEIANRNLVQNGYKSLIAPRLPKKFRKRKEQDESLQNYRLQLQEEEAIRRKQLLESKEKEGKGKEKNNQLEDETIDNHNEEKSDSQKAYEALGEVPPPPSQIPVVVSQYQDTLLKRDSVPSLPSSRPPLSPLGEDPLSPSSPSTQESRIPCGQRINNSQSLILQDSSQEFSLTPGQPINKSTPSLSPIMETNDNNNQINEYDNESASDKHKEEVHDDNVEQSDEEDIEYTDNEYDQEDDEENEYETDDDARSTTPENSSAPTSPDSPHTAERVNEPSDTSGNAHSRVTTGNAPLLGATSLTPTKKKGKKRIQRDYEQDSNRILRSNSQQKLNRLF